LLLLKISFKSSSNEDLASFGDCSWVMFLSVNQMSLMRFTQIGMTTFGIV
jgi:hypothetical protein